jgi:Raf kinase inhibitor-like YbhB/YbcL family protein
MEVAHAAKSLIGHLLRPIHAGEDKLATQQPLVDRANERIEISSDAFGHDEAIPTKYSQDGQNISPALRWSNVPKDAKELVLICEDPDAPMPQPYVHWILFGLSPSADHLPEHVPTTATVQAGGFDAQQSLNSANKVGYIGPKPPIGHGVHHYHFQMFALNAPSLLGGQPDRDTIAKSIKDKVMAAGDLVGLYERK